jgi:hypothetical protein
MPPQPVAQVLSGVRPALLKDRDAAAYLGRSIPWIRGMRLADTRAVAAGGPTRGPKWIVIHKSIFYRLPDLDAWIGANAIECGQVAFKGRGGGAA